MRLDTLRSSYSNGPSKFIAITAPLCDSYI